MKNKNPTIVPSQDYKTWLIIIAVYQIFRAIVGQSLLPFPLDLFFRILLLSSGILVFYNKKIGEILLFIVLIVSIPCIEVVSDSQFFSWPPVVLNLPMGLYFTLFSMEDFLRSQGISFSLNCVYIILFFGLRKTY